MPNAVTGERTRRQVAPEKGHLLLLLLLRVVVVFFIITISTFVLVWSAGGVRTTAWFAICFCRLVVFSAEILGDLLDKLVGGEEGLFGTRVGGTTAIPELDETIAAAARG